MIFIVVIDFLNGGAATGGTSSTPTRSRFLVIDGTTQGAQHHLDGMTRIIGQSGGG